MSEGVASLRHQINSAEELESVVRSMKAMASSNISQYENAVRSLDDYYRTVQLGLTTCFKQHKTSSIIGRKPQPDKAAIAVIVFGSNQGLVGQFNEVMVTFVSDSLMKLPGNKTLWAVGERLQSRLAETKLTLEAGFELPNSIGTISTLVGKILIEIESQREQGFIDRVYLFHHRPHSGSIYTPVSQQLLPLDQHWRHHLAHIHWPTNNLPEVMPDREQTLRAMVREYLFVSLFRACAESLASENASRLSAMQRAEKNINELQASLKQRFHCLRQSSIDAELFDVICGFGSMK
ncbi:F0F1 ATP synthase subunit gamma [Shewanella sp. SG41-4]|uniref:F0F1 ATP synthase subunit gamma n=1 Tax=Shewanella sp. SG41-4 TaxID=2760976 RepID=UPI00160020F4|nr:F0F1 ATP synthase subunit gamma [Shewanella sp. SG41-4]MBB1437173.1 F0F1 ATP synthase subunit gamma [Shewanella sp. SG41-4]